MSMELGGVVETVTPTPDGFARDGSEAVITAARASTMRWGQCDASWLRHSTNAPTERSPAIAQHAPVGRMGQATHKGRRP